MQHTESVQHTCTTRRRQKAAESNRKQRKATESNGKRKQLKQTFTNTQRYTLLNTIMQNLNQNQFCTLKDSLVDSGHWYDHENCLNYPNDLKKPCGAIGDVLTQNEKRHFFTDRFCLTCPTKFVKSVLQLYKESESVEGCEEKSLYSFYTYLKPLLLNMESDDGDVGGEPTLDEQMADVEKECYRLLREANHLKFDRIQTKLLETIEANK